MTKYPFLERLREGIPRRLLSLESPGFWYDFTPFWHVVDWCAPDWLKNAAGWRLVQVVVVVARRTDYVPRRNDQLPTPVTSVRDQHTTRLGSVVTAYHDET